MAAKCAEKLMSPDSRVQAVKLITQWDNCQYQLIQVYNFNSDANFDSIIRFLAEIVEN